jgi:hypothetical protein
MKVFNCKSYISAFGLLLLMGSAAHATTLYVNCDGKAGLASIGAALKSLRSPLFSGPNTINVSGACNENIVIKDMDRLTLNAVNGASITDASNGHTDVINVNNSPGFTLHGFAIFAINANNDGVEFTLPAVSQGNQQQGILATRNATVRCQGCTVSGNGAEGINLDLTASAFVGPYSFNSGAVAGNVITGNSGSGVLVGDLSSATFQGNASNISGNGQPDISCLGPTSVTRRAVATVGATHTNCTN